MGNINIQTNGSFRPHMANSFTALHGGHADAVASAIEWLAESVLPAAIAWDHELHTQGEKPSDGFGQPEVRARVGDE